MNLLAHFLLADYSNTSYAGQVLGDMIKGRLDDRFPVAIREGIALHRRIDRLSDDHSAHIDMRRRFAAPYRRYAGILVDIGFDASLVRAWSDYSDMPLSRFAAHAEARVRDEWPAAAPGPARRMRGLADVLTGYATANGLQRALDSVAGRLRRANPVAEALPLIQAQQPAFDRALTPLLRDLTADIQAVNDHC